MEVTIESIKANNVVAGQRFFSRENMKFFNSYVLKKVYGGKFFITRETDPSGHTAYTVREAIDGGKKIKTRSNFNGLTMDQAKKYVDLLLRELWLG